jgi:hypothetical protein
MADQLMHDRVVREVAAERFSLDDWEVTTNFAADGGSPGDIGPDITAMHGASVVAVGEVETAGTICEERARHWKRLGEECVRFYLYVPEGAEEEAVRLISEHEIACAGLRSYSCNGRV